MGSGFLRGDRPAATRAGLPTRRSASRKKSAKLVYRDKRMVAEFLAKHIFGKIVPADVAERAVGGRPTTRSDTLVHAPERGGSQWQWSGAVGAS